MFKRKSQSGFTLVELLVVLAIIGVLAAIVTINFDQARKSARDKARKSDLQSLQLAVELYKSQNGRYPDRCPDATGSNWSGPGDWDLSGFITCENYISGLTPDYIPALPTSPKNEYETNRGFMYKTDGKSYKIVVVNAVERDLITSYGDEFARCPRVCASQPACANATPNSNDYAVYSPGAECW